MIKELSSNRSFSGYYKRFSHHSNTLNCEMIFGIYLPDAIAQKPLPLLWWLSGLTCNDENFMQKAGAHQKASELGLIIVTPDTSPRGTDLPKEHDEYDLGSGAGFYVNATESPWAEHYQMYDYITIELPEIIQANFSTNGQESIFGHSMGGHGALISALRNPERYTSVSAFAPIVNPIESPWGQKAFTHYLGNDQTLWAQYDACELIKQIKDDGKRLPLFVDQGESDQFLSAQLKPDHLEAVCTQYKHPLNLRRQANFDHSYFFIATFMEDHLNYHHQQMQKL